MAIRPEFTVASFCAGVGGLDLGIRIAVPRARTVLYVERESYAASTLVARMEDAALDEALIWDDICSFDGRPWRGRVHLIIAGLPCQPYSIAGKRLGHEDERAIWPEFIRVVGEMQPWLVFIENVPEFLRYFRPVGIELSRLGYVVEEPLFVTAAECRGSHERERLFILAHRPVAFSGCAVDERRRESGNVRGSAATEPSEGNQRQRDGSSARDGREDLALATRGGLGSVRQPSERNGLSWGGNAKLEHAQGERRPTDPKLIRLGGADVDGPDSAVGNPESERPREARSLRPDGPPDGNSGAGRDLWTTPQAHDEHKGSAQRVGRYGTRAGGANLTDDAALWDESR